MKRTLFACLALVVAVAGCASVDTASRNTTTGMTTLEVQPAPVAARSYNIVDFNFTIPTDLTISEAEVFYPIADIVWRGDPRGDRRLQIMRIFQDAMVLGTADLDGNRDVIVDVVLARFHAVTNRTRWSVGGTHSIRFDLYVRDAATGVVLEGPRRITADLNALGGAFADAAEQAGQTQKVRIIDHLSSVLRSELIDMPAI